MSLTIQRNSCNTVLSNFHGLDSQKEKLETVAVVQLAPFWDPVLNDVAAASFPSWSFWSFNSLDGILKFLLDI